MTMSTTATLITTMTAFTVADSLTPIMSSRVTAIVMRTAGRLNTAVVPTPFAAIARFATCTIVPGAALTAAGKDSPSWCSSVTRLPDQPTATVAAPSAYSRIRSHPITQATNSPSVAYA